MIWLCNKGACYQAPDKVSSETCVVEREHVLTS